MQKVQKPEMTIQMFCTMKSLCSCVTCKFHIKRIVSFSFLPATLQAASLFLSNASDTPSLCVLEETQLNAIGFI